MRKTEAKLQVLREWRQWRDETARSTTLAPLEFYHELRERRPDLVSFRYAGDRYQVVAGWVRSVV